MTDHSRIDDLRRRVQKDPASIAFAQLAEECRRAGLFQEAIDACRTGLALHPGYLSARVTLGRALLHLGQLDQAQRELEEVRRTAPDNLAALRGLAEVHERKGSPVEAQTYHGLALRLAPNDPEIERAFASLASRVDQQTQAAESTRAVRLLTVLEQWLAAIHVSRA